MIRALAGLPPTGAVDKARANVQRVIDRADGNLAELRRMLEEARARLRDRALTGTEADAAYARQMVQAVEEEIRRLNEKLKDPILAGLRGALVQGDGDVIDQAREALGAGRFVGIVGVDNVLLDFASADSADLVKQVSEQLRAKLNRTFRAASTGSVTTEQVAQQIGATLVEADRPSGIFGSIYTQVDRVMRTESGRMYQAAGEARMHRVATDTGLRMEKRWVKTRLGDGRDRESHLELNGTTIPLEEHFNVGVFGEAADVSFEEAGRRGLEQGERASGPLDPALSAEQAVNCTCASISVFPTIEQQALAAVRAGDAVRAYTYLGQMAIVEDRR